jgi:uncharacterized protein YacL
MRNAFIHAIADSLPAKIELTEENIKKIKERIAEDDRRELCYVTYGLIPAMIPGFIISIIISLTFFQSLPLILIIANVLFASFLTVSFLYGKKKILEMGGCYDLVVVKNERIEC